LASVGWRHFEFKNRRDQKLAAMILKSNNRANNLVIVCHGFSGSKEGQGQAVEMSEQLKSRGISTLLFDFAGSGKSEGEDRERTLSKQVEDLAAAVAWARQEDFKKIILSGRSFGGSTVLSYAAHDQKIAAVCTWAAVARLERFFLPLVGGRAEGPADELIVLEGEKGRLELQRSFFQDLKNHDIARCAASVAPRSLLVVHGTADESVPPEEAVIIYRAASEPKQLAWIEGADHRFSNHSRQAWEVFFKWLEGLRSSQRVRRLP